MSKRVLWVVEVRRKGGSWQPSHSYHVPDAAQTAISRMRQNPDCPFKYRVRKYVPEEANDG